MKKDIKAPIKIYFGDIKVMSGSTFLISLNETIRSWIKLVNLNAGGLNIAFSIEDF